MSDLRKAASDCADELEAAVNERYGAPDIHPAYVRKYERDMEPVRAVRQALIADSAASIARISAALATPADALQQFVDSQKPLAPEDRPTSQQLWDMYDSAPADARPEQEETTLAVEVRRAVNAALSVITKLNGGELQWTIGIPARPSDPDIIIGVALNAACRAADALSRPATQQETTVHGVVFVLLRDGHVLLERCPRKREVLGVGEWFLPGGKLEAGESEGDALRREMAEELGVSPFVWCPLPVIEGSPIPPTSRGVFLMRPYLVTEWRGELPLPLVTLDQQTPLRWVPIEEALLSPVPQVRGMVAMCGAFRPATASEPTK